jgi:hypothetical protein
MKRLLPVSLVLCLAASLTPTAAQNKKEDHPGTPHSQDYDQQKPDAELRQLLGEIDQNQLQATVQKLISFGTRHTASSQTDPVRGIGAATNWVFDQLQASAAASNGQMTVQRQSFTQPVGPQIPVPTTITNILATLSGSATPNRFYVVVAHLDDRVSDVLNFTADSPGADRDATGVAVVLELARIMAKRQPKATIIFSVVGGEEEGLFGSSFEAQQLAAAGKDVQGALDVDTVGNSTAQDGTQDAHEIRLFTEGVPTAATSAELSIMQSVGGEDDSSSRELGRFVKSVAENDATDMTIWLIKRRDRYLRGSDQISFSQQRYPAVRFTEPNENWDHEARDVQVVNGVQFGDLVTFLDFKYLARAARVTAASLWSLTEGPGTPKNVHLHTAQSVTAPNSANSTSLDWDQGMDPGLAGYEVVWRNFDDADWTHVISVGNVASVTFQFFPKDNFIIGVRAVDTDGHHSPVAYPTIVN